jgi:hypothetical protein
MTKGVLTMTSVALTLTLSQGERGLLEDRGTAGLAVGEDFFVADDLDFGVGAFGGVHAGG